MRLVLMLVAVTAGAPLVNLGSRPARAQDAAPPDTVLAGVLEDWPPAFTTDAAGRPTGFAVDVMNEVARRAGLQVRYESFSSFPEAMDALFRGQVDLIPSVGILPFRRDSLNLGFTRPYETHAIVLFVRTSSADVQGLSDLEGRSVGVVQSNVGTRLAEEGPFGTTVTFPDAVTALFGLLSGEVDGLIYPEPVILHYAQAANVEQQIRIVGPHLEEVRRGMAVSAARTNDLLPRLDAALAEVQASPRFGELYARWRAPERPLLSREELIGLFAGILTLVLVGMGLWRHVSLLRVNRRLRREETRFRSLVEGLGEGIMIADLDEGRLEYVNRRCGEILGYDPHELEGMKVEELLLSDQERIRMSERLRDRASGTREAYEVEVARKDGTPVWLEVHASPYELDGEVVGSLAAITDISARKRAEREVRERNRQLAQSQRLEAVGRLAGGIAHDFNNLMTGVSVISSLLLEEADASHPWREDLEEILHSTERAAALTRQLLLFSGERSAEVEILDPGEVVRRTEAMLRRMIGEDVHLKAEVHEDTGNVKMERSHLEQIVVNLAVNARDAMPQGGELLLELREMPKPDAPELEGVQAPGWIQLRVKDTGVGMDEEVQQRIFEPFFTTKGPGQGSGLGLSTVYGIVMEMGGTIRVESEVGVGTEFRIVLPCCEGSEE